MFTTVNHRLFRHGVGFVGGQFVGDDHDAVMDDELHIACGMDFVHRGIGVENHAFLEVVVSGLAVVGIVELCVTGGRSGGVVANLVDHGDVLGHLLLAEGGVFEVVAAVVGLIQGAESGSCQSGNTQGEDQHTGQGFFPFFHGFFPPLSQMGVDAEAGFQQNSSAGHWENQVGVPIFAACTAEMIEPICGSQLQYHTPAGEVCRFFRHIVTDRTPTGRGRSQFPMGREYSGKGSWPCLGLAGD